MRLSFRTGRVACLLIVSLWLGGCGTTGESPPSFDADRLSAAAETARPPFFRVEGGRGAALLLMGTIHLGPAEGWRFSPEIQEGIDSAQGFRLEVDPRLLDEDAIGSLLAEKVVLPVGTTLDDVVSPETAKLLIEQDALLTELGMPALARHRFKPWFLATGLIQTATARSGYDPMRSADGAILAAIGERPLEGLETFDEAIALFDALSPTLQDLMLRDTLGRLDEALDEVEKLIRAWERGDRAALESIARQGIDELPELEAFYDILLGGRNRGWAEQLRRDMDDPARAGTTIFVGVGALHLVGGDALQTMLADAGYRVTTIH